MASFQVDSQAQQLWRGLAAASDSIAQLVTEIPFATVRGERTRQELQEAQALLGQAAALLLRTSEREASRYVEGSHG